MATPGDQSGPAAAKGSKLRYPLRSASRGKVEPPAAVEAPPSGSAAPRRVKPSSDVTRSVCALDLSSVKDKSAKPPRRHSIPTKPGASPRPAATGTITPVSVVRSRRSDSLGKFDTPTSEASMSTGRRKFSTLSSISYWMTQIRLAEAASKHSISLGFFKLALQSECEPLDRMREELKAYVARHGLTTELEEPVKDVLQVYDIAEDFEKLKISAETSQEAKKADKAALSATNVTPKGSLKPRSLNSVATQNKDGKKENIQKEKPDAKVRGSYNRNPTKNATGKETAAKTTVKKTKKQAKEQQEDVNGGSDALSVGSEQASVDVVKEMITYEDKENMGDTEMAIDAGNGIAQEV